MANRISSHIKKVAFGNSFAFKIESDFLKAEIARGVLGSILSFKNDEEAYNSIKKEIQSEPIDGFINVVFEHILRYTYVQHNYLLFCYTIPTLFDCSDIPTAMVLSRRCTVMINKYTQEMYLVSFRFSEDMYTGTVLDGILLEDNCVYPNYFENTYELVTDKSFKLSEDLLPEYTSLLDKHTKQKQDGTSYKFVKTAEKYFRDQPEWNLYYETKLPETVIRIISTYYDPYRNQLEEEELASQPLKEKIVETDVKIVWNNYKEITETLDFDDVYKQKRLPSMFIFHVQAVYQIFGERIAHSDGRLIDAISYSTLLRLQQQLFQSDEHWVKDSWIEPFQIKNSIDTMYYTRHTQVDLRNPYHNDYLRYHPQATPNSEHNTEECEYKHFIPQMTEDGKKWTNIYTLGKELVLCTLHRTKFPYVYKLTSNDSRVEDGQLAKVYTLECRRYIRVVLNKIHGDRDSPVLIKCRPVIQLHDNEIIGWIPVKYDLH